MTCSHHASRGLRSIDCSRATTKKTFKSIPPKEQNFRSFSLRPGSALTRFRLAERDSRSRGLRDVCKLRDKKLGTQSDEGDAIPLAIASANFAAPKLSKLQCLFPNQSVGECLRRDCKKLGHSRTGIENFFLVGSPWSRTEADDGDVLLPYEAFRIYIAFC